MRFYDVTISQIAGGPPVQLQARGPNGIPLPGAPVQSTARWTSHPNGVLSPPNPAALDVEFDLYVAPYGIPDGPPGNSFVRVWGVDLPTLATARQFAGNPLGNPATPPMFFSVKGGMGKGLPLANPAQAGPLIAGQVWQSSGNWSGTDQTLDLLLNAAMASFDRPANIILNWTQGQPLGPALQSALSIAFPKAKIVVSISANLVAPANITHFAGTLTELAQFLTDYTQALQGAGSLGVQITALGTTIKAFDGTTPPTPTQIAFADLIGQPTWQDVNHLWFQTVMRSDIQVGNTVKMPPELAQLGSLVLTPPQSLPA
jgi:hypothetical protein